MTKDDKSVTEELVWKEDRGIVPGVEGDGSAQKRDAVWTGIWQLKKIVCGMLNAEYPERMFFRNVGYWQHTNVHLYSCSMSAGGPR
jgi:hypothetical protein